MGLLPPMGAGDSGGFRRTGRGRGQSGLAPVAGRGHLWSPVLGGCRCARSWSRFCRRSRSRGFRCISGGRACRWATRSRRGCPAGRAGGGLCAGAAAVPGAGSPAARGLSGPSGPDRRAGPDARADLDGASLRLRVVMLTPEHLVGAGQPEIHISVWGDPRLLTPFLDVPELFSRRARNRRRRTAARPRVRSGQRQRRGRRAPSRARSACPGRR
jgi:hypothetical protein